VGLSKDYIKTPITAPPAGLEPAIFGLEVQRVIHYATRAFVSIMIVLGFIHVLYIFVLPLYSLHSLVVTPAVWSSGMIPASGAGGPGFDPRNSPVLILNIYRLPL
jgi:hypothetical protein